jgi:hypothetical protein
MEVSEARRLKALEEEDCQLKQLLAEKELEANSKSCPGRSG